MDHVISITDDIHWVGVNDYETSLFEAIWPLERGVSYNAYLIDDEKVALVDAVKKSFVSDLVARVRRVLGTGRKIDYLIVNHMEPDHSGAIQVLRGMFPELTVVGNQKTAGLLEGFYGLRENVHVVADGDTLDLGKHKLRFFLTPMVHWPETMMTFDETSGVLFSGDAFGGFGALPEGIFDDQVDTDYYEDEILRYFSNIIGKYSSMVQKAVSKLDEVDVKIVASTHGPIWRQRPRKIIADYLRWARQETEPGIVIAFASMYGNTLKMAEEIGNTFAEEGIEKVRVHNLSRSHVSYVIRDTWRFKALVLGSPTYNTKVFPLMDALLGHLENDRLKGRLLGIFGTYGWSKGAVSRMMEFANSGGWELVEPVIEAHCAPKDEHLDQCREMARKMAGGVKAAGEG